MKRTYIFVFIALLISVQSLQGQRKQAFTTETLFQLEGFGGAQYSPDGQKLVYQVKRPKSGLKAYNEPQLFEGFNRSDLWVSDIEQQKPINITNGVKDSTGFWNPVWSPNGEYLSMHSTRGSENTSLWIWEKATNQLKMITDKTQGSNRWLFNDVFVYQTLPPKQSSLAPGQSNNGRNRHKNTPKMASAAWEKVGKGQEATSSILESGLPVDMASRPQGELILYNVKTGATKILGKGNFLGISKISISPDKKVIATYVLSDIQHLDGTQFMPSDDINLLKKLRLFDENGELVSKSLPSLKRVNNGSVRWSPDGRQLALTTPKEVCPKANTAVSPYFANLRKEEPSDDIFIYNLANDQLEKISLGNLAPIETKRFRDISILKINWTTDNRLILYAKKGSTDEKDSRADWWVYNDKGEWQNLTQKLASVPSALYRWEQALLGLSNGSLWKIPVGSGSPENLTSAFTEKITAIRFSDAIATLGKLIFSATSKENVVKDYLLDLNSGRIKSISKPNEKANLVAFSLKNENGVFKLEDRTGGYLWLQTAGKKAAKIPFATTNTFLANVAKGETRRIEYTGLSGDSLKAWLLLPVNYDKNKSYPLVTWVYQGRMAREEDPFSINKASSLNLQLLSNRGYAVLRPSMPGLYPGRPGGYMSDYLSMQNGVIPAVDKVIEMGIANPKKLAVMGHSGGGYTTYGLITQTNRFKAAIALAGMSNLMDSYLQFNPQHRYNSYAQEFSYFMLYSESKGHGVGATPWGNPQAFIKNSPLFYADRIQTPLMIIHGDIDYVPIQSAEAIFNAMYRQGKRARFVRYWGEGHILTSKANVKDMWKQIFRWLEEHGCAPE